VSKFADNARCFFRRCLDVLAKAISADFFVYVTVLILLIYTLFRPTFMVILALLCLFTWAILF